jgi:uncharacterized protein HemX
MPKGNTLLIVIIVVAVLAGLGYWYWSQAPGAETTTPPSATTTTGVSDASRKANLLPSGSSSADASLGQDLSAIDGQMNSFTSDGASMDASLADQPGEQSSL